MSERIRWIDTAKGLLILLVVLGHIAEITGNCGINNRYLLSYRFPHYYVRSFFMQAFFIYSGFTSNYNRTAKVYFPGILKKILLPYVSFSIITKFLEMLVFNTDIYSDIGGGKFVLWIIENFWFLQSLLIAKVVYWIVVKICKSKMLQGIIFIFIMLLGFSITLYYRKIGIENPSHYNNFFHYRNALCMIPFIYIGSNFRSLLLNRKFTMLMACLFLIGCLSSFLLRHFGFNTLYVKPIPYTHTTNIQTILQVPAYLFFAVSGTCMISIIAQKIQKWQFLSFVGKNSIIIYCMHFVLMSIVVTCLSKIFIPETVFNSIIFFCLSFLFTLLLCLFFIWLFDKKPFNYMIGRY